MLRANLSQNENSELTLVHVLAAHTTVVSSKTKAQHNVFHNSENLITCSLLLVVFYAVAHAGTVEVLKQIQFFRI